MTALWHSKYRHNNEIPDEQRYIVLRAESYEQVRLCGDHLKDSQAAISTVTEQYTTPVQCAMEG